MILWIVGFMDGWMDEENDVWLDGLNELMYVCLDGLTSGWMDWMDETMDGLYGWMDE